MAVLLRGRGLRMDAHAVRFTLLPMLPSLPRILLAGVGLHLAVAWIRERSPRRYLRAVLTWRSALSWLRICAAFLLVTIAYAWLKVCVPLLNPRLWDEALWKLDRWLHFGISPSIFFAELVRGTPVAAALDVWYSLWIVTVFVAWSYAAAERNEAARRQFVFASAALSLVGSWLYLTLPALGPCYAFRDVFAGALAEMPRASSTQAALAANYAKMLAGRDGTLRQFSPYLGVAALPSLHVGGHFLFALWARRWARWAYVPLLVATLLTFLGSLATGWHYAIDGYLGLLLAWLAFRAAIWIENDTLGDLETTGESASTEAPSGP